MKGGDADAKLSQQLDAREEGRGVNPVEVVTIPQTHAYLPRQAAACALEAYMHPNGYAASWDGGTTATRIDSDTIHVSVALRGGGCDVWIVRPPESVLFELTVKKE